MRGAASPIVRNTWMREIRFLRGFRDDECAQCSTLLSSAQLRSWRVDSRYLMSAAIWMEVQFHLWALHGSSSWNYYGDSRKRNLNGRVESRSRWVRLGFGLWRVPTRIFPNITPHWDSFLHHIIFCYSERRERCIHYRITFSSLLTIF